MWVTHKLCYVNPVETRGIINLLIKFKSFLAKQVFFQGEGGGNKQLARETYKKVSHERQNNISLRGRDMVLLSSETITFRISPILKRSISENSSGSERMNMAR